MPRSGGRRGAALIVALFSLLLITLVVLAFFGQARLNRQISFSSASQARANILALSALDFVKADFVAEIVAGSTIATVSGTGAYEPRAPQNMLPYSMLDDVNISGDKPFNLIKWSSATTELWRNGTQGAFVNNGGTPAVTVSTTAAARNGRYIDHNRWNKTGFVPLPVAIDPQWVLLTRSGPAAATTITPAMTDTSGTNPDYIVGRYAYVVYDTGGLLDINAAGYPDSSDTDHVARKGSLGYADLSQIGLSEEVIDTLIREYRNKTTAEDAEKYDNYLKDTALASGFLKAADGDSAFISRQDFLQASNKLGITQFTPYFTTFSRAKNSPSWGPAHNAADGGAWSGSNTSTEAQPNPDTGTRPSYAYKDNRNSADAFNRFFPNVTVSGSFKRLDGQPAKEGEPLVKHRFDLAKVDWIRFDGQPPEGVTEDDIYKNFGLRRVPAGTTTPKGLSIGGAWIYDHGGYTADGRVKILTLQEVADLPEDERREPDFFELLQAAILRGGLGLVTGNYDNKRFSAPNEGNVPMDMGEYLRTVRPDWFRDWRYFSNANGSGRGTVFAITGRAEEVASGSPTGLALVYAQEKYQILQIGANIIDQWDQDSIPTEIRIGHRDTAIYPLGKEAFYGVENLPFIWSIGISTLRVSPNAGVDNGIFPNTFQAFLNSWLTFALWNPHANASDLQNASGGQRPTNLRIIATSGKICLIQHDFSRNTSAGFYAGRDFRSTNQPVRPAKINNAYEWPSGPAWVGFRLTDYNYFDSPATLDPDRAFTQYAYGGGANMNHNYGLFKSSYGYKRAGIYLGYIYSPLNPYIIPATRELFKVGSNYIHEDPDVDQGYYWAKNHGEAIYPPLGASSVYGVYYSSYDTTYDEANGGPIVLSLQYENPNQLGEWHTYQTFRGVVLSGESGGLHVEEGDTNVWGVNWDTTYVPWYYYFKNDKNDNVLYGDGAGKPLKSLTEALRRHNLTKGPYAGSNDKELLSFFLSDPRSSRTNLYLSNRPVLADNFSNIEAGVDRLVYDNGSLGPHFIFDRAVGAYNGGDTRKSPRYWAVNRRTSDTYYSDRDYVVRSADTISGNLLDSPLYTPLTSARNFNQRPIMLNRRFRSVAELGFVYRDDPWKTLNLYAANSADSGLLDIFYLGSGRPDTTAQPDVVAGKININSAARDSANGEGAEVFAALISGAAKNYNTFRSGTAGVGETFTSSETADLARAVWQQIAAEPLSNLGGLPALLPKDAIGVDTVNTNFSADKNQREAVLRAITDTAQTRTWNLLIDIIVQAGRYVTNATRLEDFTVEGEKHYWLHVAIDRFTGEIVDQQLEPVIE